MTLVAAALAPVTLSLARSTFYWLAKRMAITRATKTPRRRIPGHAVNRIFSSLLRQIATPATLRSLRRRKYSLALKCRRSSNKLRALGGNPKYSILGRFGKTRKVSGVGISRVPAVHSNGLAFEYIDGELGAAMEARGFSEYFKRVTGFILWY
jgi:hypothetical protein